MFDLILIIIIQEPRRLYKKTNSVEQDVRIRTEFPETWIWETYEELGLVKKKTIANVDRSCI